MTFISWLLLQVCTEPSWKKVSFYFCNPDYHIFYPLAYFRIIFTTRTLLYCKFIWELLKLKDWKHTFLLSVIFLQCEKIYLKQDYSLLIPRNVQARCWWWLICILIARKEPNLPPSFCRLNKDTPLKENKSQYKNRWNKTLIFFSEQNT